MVKEGNNTMLSEAIHKYTRVSELDRKVFAVDELLFQTKELRVRTARFAKIAWTLDMILLFLAILVFYSVIYLALFYIYNVIPSAISQRLDPILDSDDFYMGWLCCLLVLVTLPVVSDVILAIVCKHPSGTKVQTENKVLTGMPQKLRHIEVTLNEVQLELPWGYDPGIGGHFLCALFTILFSVALLFFNLSDYSTATKPQIPETILIVILAVAICAGLFELLLFLKKQILNLAFSNWRSRKQIDCLYTQFLKEAKLIWPKYKTRSEEYDEYKKQREREEYEQFIRDNPDFLEFLYQFEKRSQTSSHRSLTYKDHDELDAVAKAMRDNYGPDWGKDL